MKILGLQLGNFRKLSSIPEPTVLFNSDINILLGANNAGKTSILHAIQKIFRTLPIQEEKDLNYLIQDGTLNISAQISLNKEEWLSFLQLGFNTSQPYFKLSENTPNLEEVADKLKDYPFELKHISNIIGRKRANHIVKAILPENIFDLKNQDLHLLILNTGTQLQNSEFYSIYKSPLYLDSKGKIADKEPFIPLNSLGSQNNTEQSNIRGLLYALKKKKPQEFELFKKRLLTIFEELDDIDVINNEDLGQFELVLTEKLKKNGGFSSVKYDINNVGQGMQALVMMLSTILLLNPKIALMDEPEVHMHPNLIKEFARYIQLLAVDTQFFISTHSLQLINEFGLDKAFLLKNETEQKGIIIAPLHAPNQLLEAVESLGYVVDTFTHTLKPSITVFTEGDSDRDLILGFAEKAGLNKHINLLSVGFVPMNGKGDRHKLLGLFEKLNSDFSQTPFLMLLDKDETSQEEIESIRKRFFSQNPERLHYLQKRQIENYLLDSQAISSIISKKTKQAHIQEVEQQFLLLAEQQKNKILDNYVSELFIRESLLKTADLRGMIKQLQIKPLNDAVREFTGELFKQVGLNVAGLGQKTNTTIEEFETEWNKNKLEMIDGRILLSSLNKWIQQNYKLSCSYSEIIQEMAMPEEINQLLQKIVDLQKR